MKEWLTSEGVDVPDCASRLPRKAEVREVLAGLQNLSVRYTENGDGERWDAMVDDDDKRQLWTLLHAEPESGNEDATRIDFEKGSPWLVIAILRALSASTGPLVLLDDSGSKPLVVRSDTPLIEVVRSYCTVDPESTEWKRLLTCVPSPHRGTEV
jgi:hypothetical protein